MKTASLALTRDSGYADRLRKYRVICDKVEIGRISDGEVANFEVAPGDHHLILKVDWCTSNEVKFSVAEDQVASFYCGSSLRGFRLALTVFYIIFARHRYLWLKLQGI